MVFDAVRETSSSVNTVGDVVLAGADGGGFRTFASLFADGDLVVYALEGRTGALYDNTREIGVGTFRTSPDRIERTDAGVAWSTSGPATRHLFATSTSLVAYLPLSRDALLSLQPPELAAEDFWFETECFSLTEFAPFQVSSIAGGTVTAPATTVNRQARPGVVQFNATASNSGVSIHSDGAAFRFGAKNLLLRVKLKTPASFGAGFDIYVGFTNDPSSHGLKANHFQVQDNNYSTRAASSSSSTQTASLSADTWYTLEFEVAADGATAWARTYNDAGALVVERTFTTNIPTAAGQEVGVRVCGINTSGSASDVLMVDRIGVGTVNGYKRARGIPRGLS